VFEYFFNRTKISPEKAALFLIGNSKLKEQVQLVNAAQRRFDKNYVEHKNYVKNKNYMENNNFELYGFKLNKYQWSILNYSKNLNIVNKSVNNTVNNPTDNSFCTLDAAYNEKYASLEKRYSKLNEEYLSLEVVYNDKYTSLEAAYNDKYSSLEAVYKKQIEDLNTQLIAAVERDKEWCEENSKLVKEFNEVASSNNIKVAAYKGLLEKYMSLTSLYDSAVARNKQFDAYLEAHVSTPAGVEKMWTSLKEHQACNEALTKNNTILKEENKNLHKDCSRATLYCERLMLENKKLKSLLEGTSTSSELLTSSEPQSSEDFIVQMHEQTIINNDGSEYDDILDKTLDLFLGY
jgi:hypothetical protein